MGVKITYPHIDRQEFERRHILRVLEGLMLLAALVCPVINLAVGGRAWSVVVEMSLYAVHTLILSPDLVEYNRIRQSVKFMTCLCVLLVFIDVFLCPGWADFVTSVICCCGLIVLGMLFFTDFNRQKKNMLPMLLFVAFLMLRAGFGICTSAGEARAAFVLMEVLATALLLMFVAMPGNGFMLELRRRFYIQ